MGSFSLLLVIIGVFLRVKVIKRQTEKNVLLQQIKLLKAETLMKMKSKSSVISNEQLELSREKIENAINASLNQSDWNIINELYYSPVITNNEIAKQVTLSVEGVKSSLKKMYNLFDVPKSAQNKRILLIIKAKEFSSKS